MKRRLAAILMVIVSAVTVSTGALSSGTATEIHALYKEPVIDVRVPSTGQVLLNPESLPVNVGGHVESAQIVSTPWSIENYSEVGVKVDAVVSAEVAGGSTMEFYKRSVKTKKTRKKLVFMFLDMKVTDPGVSLEGLNWPETVYNSKKQILITEKANDRENIMILAPADINGNLSNGGIGAFHLGGDAVATPRDAWNPATDKMTVKISFTFRPARYETE